MLITFEFTSRVCKKVCFCSSGIEIPSPSSSSQGRMKSHAFPNQLVDDSIISVSGGLGLRRSLSEGPAFDLDLERPKEKILAKDPDCGILIATNLLREWVGGEARVPSVESWWTRGLGVPSTPAENETRRAVEGETGLLDGENLTVAFERESSMNWHSEVLENDSGRSITIREELTATPLIDSNITRYFRTKMVGLCG